MAQTCPRHSFVGGARCNESILAACLTVLQRWLRDLDPQHLDEENESLAEPSQAQKVMKTLAFHVFSHGLNMVWGS